jgi:glutathione S-transferase
MAKLQIIGPVSSSYVWVVRMVCEEKGVAYDLVPADLRSPEVLAIHPFGKVPVMRHGDLALFESKAIATYVDRAFPGPTVIPDEPGAAAEVEQWVSAVNTTIDPCLIRSYAVHYRRALVTGGQPDRAVIDAALPTMQRQIEVLDRAVAGTGHLVGERFTLADINLMPVLYYAQLCPEGGEMVRACANLSAYFARHAERPSYQATLPPPLA